MYRFAALLAIMLSALPAAAEDSLPVLRATSNRINVQDGERLWKGVWTVDPTIALDVYNASRSNRPKKIAFISDIDRLSFDVEPNRTYDFVVLLNAKERAPTRISTMVQPFGKTKGASVGDPPTIPFEFENGRIMVKASINGSAPLNLLFDTGADAIMIHASTLEKGAQIKIDGSMPNSGLGGTVNRKTASSNTLELAGLRWENEPMIFSEQPPLAGDGILGTHIFEDKAVEIDFDRRIIVIHESVPDEVVGYTKVPMFGSGRLFSIDTTLVGGRTNGNARAFFDTGFPGVLMAYPDVDKSLGLRGELSRIGRKTTSGTGPNTIQSDTLLLPELSIAGMTLRGAPIDVEAPTPVAISGHVGAVIGIAAISRFNLIIDYPRDRLFMAPNSTFQASFGVPLGGPPWPIIVGIGALAMGLTLAGGYALRRRRHRHQTAGAMHGVTP
jgi:hypothetical protein